mmetsp:Transcript_66077/g.158033  ORF Transcript_66077/g.158033 Transcript_66077/m.158033 type:complete len:842 (-) Transcript_66077:90-2615(-)
MFQASEAKTQFRAAVDAAAVCFTDALTEEISQQVYKASAYGSQSGGSDLMSEVLMLRKQLQEADNALLQMLKGSLEAVKPRTPGSDSPTLTPQNTGTTVQYVSTGPSCNHSSGHLVPLQSPHRLSLGLQLIPPMYSSNRSGVDDFGRNFDELTAIASGDGSELPQHGMREPDASPWADKSDDMNPKATDENEKQSNMSDDDDAAEAHEAKLESTNRVPSAASHPSLAMWPVWLQECDDMDVSHQDRHSYGGASASLSSGGTAADTDHPTDLNGSLVAGIPTANTKAGDMVRGRGPLQCLIIRPNSYYRICWDLLSCLVLAVDIISVSLALSFDLESDFLSLMDLCVVVFWSCDCLQAFFAGYHDGGIVELRPSKTAKRYMRGWFFFDVSLLLIDWANLINNFVDNRLASLIRLGKTIRVARVMRVIRVMRAIKVILFVDALSENIRSEGTRELLKIFKMMVGIAFMNHFVACGWYMIGSSLVPWEEHWIDSFDECTSKGFFYATALHWSLTQFTPASMEIHPHNIVERVYAIVVIFFALVCFSSFLSTITQAMMNIQNVNNERMRLKEHVDRFITENELTLELGNRINSFIRTVHRHLRSRVHEEDIPQFKTMPIGLLMDLHHEVFVPVLSKHPVLSHLSKFDSYWMTRLCHNFVHQKALQQDAEVFTKGLRGKYMYFVRAGRVSYCHEETTRDVTTMEDGQHFSEMCLWVRWTHKGRVVTKTPVEIVTLQASGLRQISRFLTSYRRCQEYAKLFTELLMEEGSWADTWGDLVTTKLLFLRAFGLTDSLGSGGELGMQGVPSMMRVGGIAQRLRKFTRLRRSHSRTVELDDLPDRQHTRHL